MWMKKNLPLEREHAEWNDQTLTGGIMNENIHTRSYIHV